MDDGCSKKSHNTLQRALFDFPFQIGDRLWQVREFGRVKYSMILELKDQSRDKKWQVLTNYALHNVFIRNFMKQELQLLMIKRVKVRPFSTRLLLRS